MFKTRLLITMLIIIYMSLFPTTSHADRARGAVLFLTIGPGARAAGMGEAFVAVADDPTATYWNPAGLGKFPLSSRWHKFPFPQSGIVSIAAVKTIRSDIDFRKFDLWAATQDSLWVLRRDRWLDHDEYTVDEPDGLPILVILDEFAMIRTYDSTYINRTVIPEFKRINNIKGDTVPQDVTVKIPFKLFVPDRITCLAGGDEVLFVGTENGVYKNSDGVWRKLKGRNSPEGLKILDMSIDSKGNLWAATKEGLFVARGTRWSKYNSSNGLPSSSVTAVCARTPKDVWVATKRGIVHFDGVNWKTTYHYYVTKKPTWEQIASAVTGAKGRDRLVALTSKLKAANGNPESETAPSDVKVPYDLPVVGEVNKIFLDSKGNVWFGTNYGLIRFDGKKFKVFGWRAEIASKETNIKDWISSKWAKQTEGTKEKLYEKIRTFNHLQDDKLEMGETIEYPSSPASGKIIDMTEGFTKGDILVATEYGLLRYYNKLKQFRYVLSGGFEKKFVKKLVSSGGEYWFATPDELTIYSKGKPGVSLMHVKWLPELAPDIYYEYLTGVYYLEDWGTVGGAITFISLGRSEQTNEVGEKLGGFYSYEMAVAASYGAKLAKGLYGGLNFKFIYSALAPRIYVGHEKKSGVGSSFAVDLGLLYETPLRGLTIGANAQHIGPNIHYIDAAQADPLPRTLRVGMAYRIRKSDYHSLIFAADIEKEIIKFKSAENPWALEWHYAVKHLGFEYTYSNFFSIRGGYIIDYDYYPRSEALDKVQQPGYKFNPDDYVAINYFTFGFGLHYGNLVFNFAYIPKVSDPEHRGGEAPLSNIMRLSITANF